MGTANESLNIFKLGALRDVTENSTTFALVFANAPLCTWCRRLGSARTRKGTNEDQPLAAAVVPVWRLADITNLKYSGLGLHLMTI